MTNTEPNIPVNQPEPEKELLTWTAPSRLFKKRKREFYTTIAALVILISLILLFAKEFLLIAVILSFGFLSYVLASIEPDPITHTLTSKGVRTAEKLYLWESISRYWWETKWNQTILHLETPGLFPGQLILLIGSTPRSEFESLLKQYSLEDKPADSWIDRSSRWLQEKIPLESSDA